MGGRGDAMSHLFPAQNTVASRASHLMDIPFPIHVSAGTWEQWKGENVAIRGFSSSSFSHRGWAHGPVHHALPVSWPIWTAASPTTDR